VAGSGDVAWTDFFRTLTEHDVRCDLLIEREAGETRVDDVRAASEMIAQLDRS
jgi:L-ribulose-5-phosphate 3-epimerase